MTKFMLAVVSILIFAIPVLSADVATTQKGKHFHLVTCPKVQGKKVAIVDEVLALARNLRPCEQCFGNTQKDKKNKQETQDGEK